MARNIYGDSYGGIAGTELATDSARDSRFFNTLNANQRAQQMADAQDQAAAAQQFQWTQFLAGLAAQRRAEQERQSLEAQGLDQPHLQLAQLLQQAQLARESNAITRETNAARVGETRGNELMGLIGQGAITPNQINDLYPDLPEATRSRASAVFGNLAAQEGQQSAGNRSAAEIANQLLDAERRKAAALGAKAIPGHWWSSQPAVSVDEAKAKILADISSGKSQLPPLQPEQFKSFLDNLFRNRALMGRVSVDEENQSFAPAELPRRFSLPPQFAPPPPEPPMAAPSPLAARTVAPSIPIGWGRRQGGVMYRWDGVSWKPEL